MPGEHGCSEHVTHDSIIYTQAGCVSATNHDREMSTPDPTTPLQKIPYAVEVPPSCVPRPHHCASAPQAATLPKFGLLLLLRKQ